MLRHCKLSVHTRSSDAKNVRSVRLKNLSTFIPSPSMMSPTLMPVTFGPIVFFQCWIGPVLTVAVLAWIHRDLNHCFGLTRNLGWLRDHRFQSDWCLLYKNKAQTEKVIAHSNRRPGVSRCNTRAWYLYFGNTHRFPEVLRGAKFEEASRDLTTRKCLIIIILLIVRSYRCLASWILTHMIWGTYLCNALQIWKKRWPRSSHKGM